MIQLLTPSTYDNTVSRQVPLQISVYAKAGGVAGYFTPGKLTFAAIGIGCQLSIVIGEEAGMQLSRADLHSN